MQLGKIAIDIPDSWEDRSMYTFVAPAEVVSPQMRAKQTGFRKNLVVQRRDLGPEETLDDCVDYLVQRTEETFGAVKVTVEAGPVTEHFESKRVRYTVIDDVSNSAVGQVIYLCLMGHEEWQLAFSLPAVNVDGELSGLDEMVRSLRSS